MPRTRRTGAPRNEWAEIRDANEKLITQLERDSGAWHGARYLRGYIQAARRHLGVGSHFGPGFERGSRTFFTGAKAT